jgi:hypothetical protein
VAVIWSPLRVLRDAAAERKVLTGFVVMAVYAGLSLAAAAVAVLGGVTRAQFQGQPAGPELPSDLLENLMVATEVATLIFSVLAPFVWWIAVSLVMQLATRFFGGSGPLPAMLYSTAGTTIGLLGGLFALAAFVWHVVLVVIGAALARGMGYGESAGSCAVSCVGCLGLIILVAVVLAGVGILLGATAP